MCMYVCGLVVVCGCVFEKTKSGENSKVSLSLKSQSQSIQIQIIQSQLIQIQNPDPNQSQLDPGLFPLRRTAKASKGQQRTRKHKHIQQNFCNTHFLTVKTTQTYNITLLISLYITANMFIMYIVISNGRRQGQKALRDFRGAPKA